MSMLKRNEQKENEIKTRSFKLYAHINRINMKIYIGQTCRENVNVRWSNGNGYKRNSHFWNAIQKYGWDNFDHVILFEVNTPEEANLCEEYLINKYNTTNPNYGYNILSGGIDMTGKNNPNYGNKYSKETRILLSNKSKERFKNPSNHPRFGVHLSEETKEKIRKGNSKPYSKERKDYWIKVNSEIHSISMYDKNLNKIKQFRTLKEARKFYNKKFVIYHTSKPFYIDDKYIFIFDDLYSQVIKSDEFKEALRNYGNRRNQRKVICLNDLSIYESMSIASKEKNVSPSRISNCCNNHGKSAGYDEKLGRLLWEFYDENKKYVPKGYVSNSKKCRCITLNKIFDSTKIASEILQINQNTIAWACNPNNKNNKTNGGNTNLQNLYWEYV